MNYAMTPEREARFVPQVEAARAPPQDGRQHQEMGWKRVSGKTRRGVGPGTLEVPRRNPLRSLLVTPLLLLVMWVWLAFLLVAMALLAPLLWFMDWRDRRKGIPPFKPEVLR